MKRPKPKDFGLNGIHAPLSPADAYGYSQDADQPFTDNELKDALDALIAERALMRRQRIYHDALEHHNWVNGGR